jgi:hypothetical protein
MQQPIGQPGGFGQPPGGGFGQPPGGGFGQPPAPPLGQAQPWGPTEALSFAWERLKADPGVTIGAFFVASLLGALPGYILIFIGYGVGLGMGNDAGMVIFSVVSLLGYLVMFVGIAYVTGGIAALSLKIARGESYSFGDVFRGGPFFMPMLGSTFLMALAITAGAMACYVPGVILALGLSLYSYVVVDQKLGAVDSLKRSWELTNGHKLNIFVWWLVMTGVYMLGALACGLGAIVVAPLYAIGNAWIYLKITGQQTAATTAR